MVDGIEITVTEPVSEDIFKTGEEIKFKARVITEYGYIYTWDFKDGRRDTNYTYNEEVEITHIYSIPGVYNISIVVKDDYNNIDLKTIAVYIVRS